MLWYSCLQESKQFQLPCDISRLFISWEKAGHSFSHVPYIHLRSQLPKEAFLSDVLSPHLGPDGTLSGAQTEQSSINAWLLVLTHVHGSKHNVVCEKIHHRLYLSINPVSTCLSSEHSISRTILVGKHW